MNKVLVNLSFLSYKLFNSYNETLPANLFIRPEFMQFISIGS